MSPSATPATQNVNQVPRPATPNAGRWQSGVSKMVCDRVVCERWCVTKWCVKDGVWQSGGSKTVCERWCVTKWCVNGGVWQSCVWKMVLTKLCVWKMVCDKVVCQRWCVIKLCVKDGVSKMVCDKVVCERWCVKDGVSNIAGDKVVCERWCVKDGGWQSCVWKMVGVSKMLCDKSCVWKMVCDKVVCGRGGRARRARRRDTESKTRTPHKDVGEKHRYSTIFYLDFDIVGHTLGSKDVKCQQKCWLYLPYVVSLISATTGVLILPHLP